MNNQIQLVLKSSTTELSLNDRELGIYLTPELEGLTGLPEIRTTSGVNAGYDGGWTSAQNYDARSITIRGVIANEDVATVEQLRRQLTTLAGQGKNEELTLDLVTQAGKAYTIQVRTIALEMSLQKVLTQQEFMLQLRADDPLVYDASETTHEALLRVAQATGGFTIDFELPLAITGSSEETIVNNDGLEQVPTVTRMYGELHNPKIINQTTNQFMQIEADLGFAEGDWTTPSEPVEGKDLTINDAPDNAPLSDFKLKGNTSQQTYSGKNLFNKDTATLGKRIGTAGTLYDSADGFTSDFISATENTTYVVNYAVTSYLQRICFYNSSKTRISHVENSSSFTTPANTMYIRICAAQTILNSAQLEKGSTATSYEPYVGGIPAPNPDYPQAVNTVTGENVVKICGKNLFDKNNANVLNAYFALPNNTTITSNAQNRTLYVPCDANTTYTFQAMGSNWIRQVGYTSTTPAAGVSVSGITNLERNATSVTITTGSTAKYLVFRFWHQGNSTETYQQALDSIQIELGSTATAYEPYQGQSYEVNLGKNLLDIQATPSPDSNISQSGITYTIGADGTITTSGVSTSTYKNLRFDLTLEAGTYFFSGCPEGGSMNGYSFIVQVGSTLNGDYGSGATFTLSEKTTVRAYVVRLGGSTGVNMNGKVFKPMIVKGATPTSFAPYFTPIELCKIGTYQDYIYKDGTDWKIHKEIGKAIIDGSATWAFSTNGNAWYKPNWATTNGGITPSSNDTVADILCPYFGAVSRNSLASASSGICIATSAALNIKHPNYATSSSDFVGWLNSTLPTVYYALATPTDTEITNEALIAQLEAISQEAKMYNPQTNITTLYANGNEQGTLSISYFTDKNPDTRDELIIDSRLRTITLNGLDVYHLQAPGSEFLMLAPGENRLSLQSDITGDNGYAQVSYKQGYLSI